RRSGGTPERCPPRCPWCRRSRSPGGRKGRETVGRRVAWRHVRLAPKQTLGQGNAQVRRFVGDFGGYNTRNRRQAAGAAVRATRAATVRVAAAAGVTAVVRAANDER